MIFTNNLNKNDVILTAITFLKCKSFYDKIKNDKQ